jgi:DNA-binding MarR family transcriptional regulator
MLFVLVSYFIYSGTIIWDMSDEVTQRLLDLPPSAKLVFTVLAHEEPLTQKQVAEESRLSGRTARYALGRLKEIGAINEKMSFMDARQMLYTTIRNHHDQDFVNKGDVCRS